MKIGIIGSNDRALAIGRLLASGEHEVTLSDPRTPDNAEEAAARIGATAEIPYRQAMTREILILAVAREDVDRTITAMGSGVEAIVVDATEGKPPAGPSGAEILAKKLDSHHVVRALIVLPQAGANIPICGDDELSKEAVDRAFQACGCVTTDRGALSNAGELEAPQPANVTRGEIGSESRREIAV